MYDGIEVLTPSPEGALSVPRNRQQCIELAPLCDARRGDKLRIRWLGQEPNAGIFQLTLLRRTSVLWRRRYVWDREIRVASAHPREVCVIGCGYVLEPPYAPGAEWLVGRMVPAEDRTLTLLTA